MKISNAIFLSHQISSRIPVYGAGEPLTFRRVKSISKGDSCNTMFWSFPNHIGTHLDAPSHFIENMKSISELTPQELIFTKVKLITLKNIGPGFMITPGNLKNISDCDLLLIKTCFEDYRNKAIYRKNSISLSPELAGWLKKQCPSLRAVGINSISISNWSERESGRAAHREFLSKNILLIEDMRLNGLRDKPDLVIVAPMLVEKADGSPCTVLGIYN